MKRISKCKEIKIIIKELMSDGELHTVDEIYQLAIQKKVIKDKKDAAVKNALYQLKKEDSNFTSEGQGRYRMKKEKETESYSEITLDDSINKIVNVVEKFKKFDWVNCTDDELSDMREEIRKVRNLYFDMQILFH